MAEKRTHRKWLIALLAAGLVLIVVVLLRPSPLVVETAKAATGAMRVTVDVDVHHLTRVEGHGNITPIGSQQTCIIKVGMWMEASGQAG